MLDPGHGGTDPGTTTPIFQQHEKDINLGVVLALNDTMVIRSDPSFTVYCTREDDTTLTRYQRASMAGCPIALLWESCREHNCRI